MNESLTYQDAGVDIDKANRFIKRIQQITKQAPRSGVIAGIGGFSGLYSLDVSRYEDPVLVSSTDGVGTKLKIASMMGPSRYSFSTIFPWACWYPKRLRPSYKGS